MSIAPSYRRDLLDASDAVRFSYPTERMALAPGTRLGPYEIVAPLGAGGMGEVYRGRDTRLHRDVAIKVLPPDVSGDPARRKRFELEARAVAALTHPHICPIHDIGASGDTDYLVLELIDGETLATRLKRGPLPLPEALARAIEMAGALATAHQRGFVHRDLKPANVMLTKSGAMILDFGLARMVRDEPTTDTDRTATAPLTEVGVVVGTLQYMAPEQVEGRPADARTDVFAFGAVLYEMLTSRRAFEGSSAAGLIGAILRADAPSIAAAQPDLPENRRLDRLIRACLAKDPADRIANMHDVKLALTWIQQDLSHPPSTAGTSSAGRRRGGAWIAAGAAAALLLGLAGYAYGHRSVPAGAPAQSYVYDVPLPPSTRHYAGMALSPDGRRLALVTQTPGLRLNPRLWIRDLDSTAGWQAVTPAGDQVPHYPMWSPDGRWLAYFLMGRLVRIKPPSVVPVDICAAEDGRGGAWIDDDTIVFAPNTTSGLMRVDLNTGRVSELVAKQPGEVGLKYPSGAGSHHVIFWANIERRGENELRLVSLDDPRRVVPIVKSAAAAVYDRGTLFYVRSGVWVGQPFDIDTPQLSGEPRPIPVDSPWGGNIGAAAVSAQAGHLAANSAGLRLVQLTWVDRSGSTLGTVGEAEDLSSVQFSPDGQRLAVARTGQGEVAPDVWILDVATNGRKRATTTGASAPVWSRDGKRLAFRAAGFAGNNNVYEIDATGVGSETSLVEGIGNFQAVGWLPGGDRLVFANHGNTREAVPQGILIREPVGAPTPYSVGKGDPGSTTLSPDASRIAFISGGVGNRDLLVDTMPNPGTHPVVVTHSAVTASRWRPDGRELYFLLDGRLMSATVSDGPNLTVGTPIKLFDTAAESFEVDPTTGRFLMMMPVSTPVPSVTITLNWPRR